MSPQHRGVSSSGEDERSIVGIERDHQPAARTDASAEAQQTRSSISWWSRNATLGNGDRELAIVYAAREVMVTHVHEMGSGARGKEPKWAEAASKINQSIVPGAGKVTPANLRIVINRLEAACREYINTEGSWTGESGTNVNGIELTAAEAGTCKE